MNIAFEKLLDDLFQETAWDVSSDISVLKTMLAQEGLTKNDFQQEENDERRIERFSDSTDTDTESIAEEEKAQPEVKKEEPLMDENVLSEEERKMADQFANQIDLTNSAMILQYGAGTQSKMADFSETALENVKTKDLGEVGELLGKCCEGAENLTRKKKKDFSESSKSRQIRFRH